MGTYPSALLAADFNNDGRLDFATANPKGKKIGGSLTNFPYRERFGFGRASLLRKGNDGKTEK